MSERNNEPHELPHGVREAEERAFLDTVGETPPDEAPADSINHGHYDIADHPIVTGETSARIKGSGVKALAKRATSALVRVSEQGMLGGNVSWIGKEGDTSSTKHGDNKHE